MTHRADVTYAVYRAENPASRPKMRKTPIRSCEPRVGRWRVIVYLARVTAVEKPMQYSVPCTSLSIVVGIAMRGNPASARTWEYDNVSSPPIEMRTDTPSASRCSRTSGVRSYRSSAVAYLERSASPSHDGRLASGIVRGFVREVWRIVPPVRWLVRLFLRSSGRRYPPPSPRIWGWTWVRPSQPRRMPSTL